MVNCALAYGVDSVTFCPTVDLASNSIESDGSGLDSTEHSVTVPTIQLGRLVREHGFSRFSLVCDIEGKEYDLICHELEILKKADVIILETHARLIGEDKNKSMISRLTDVGFRIAEQDGFVITLQQIA
jgi:FkbM family methyltransferase